MTSGNKRHYDDAFLTELERQTLQNKPVGLMGHLSASDRATAFPAEAVHWVGAVRDGDTLWGKGYLPPGPVRDRIARYKASGRSIATSIDAMAEQVWDESLKAYRVNAASFRLGQIDLAPADRAGIPDLATVPMLTREIEAPELDTQACPDEGRKEVMGKLEIINELTADDARLLPKPVREAILSEVAIPPEVAVVQELRSTLGVDDKADLSKLVRELREAKEVQDKAAIVDTHYRTGCRPRQGHQGHACAGDGGGDGARPQPADAAGSRNGLPGNRRLCSRSPNCSRATCRQRWGRHSAPSYQPQNGGTQYFKYPDKKEG